MAFFGLSQVGPQSSLATGRIEGDSYSVSLFEISEFREAFTRIADGAATLPLSSIPKVLSRVFHGPAPLLESKRVAEALAVYADSSSSRHSIDIESFLEIIVELQDKPLVFDATERHA